MWSEKKWRSSRLPCVSPKTYAGDSSLRTRGSRSKRLPACLARFKISSANWLLPRYSVCSLRNGSRNTATTRVGNSRENPAGRGVEGICLRTVAVPMEACLEILFRVMRTFADPSPPSSSSTVCMILSLSKCLLASRRFFWAGPSRVNCSDGWVASGFASDLIPLVTASSPVLVPPLGPGPRGARLAERVVICGLSSGFAASGLVWAGLAAGERKKVLIVLDLGSRRLACAKLPINDRFGPRKLRRARSAAAGGRRSVPALRRRAQTSQSPTTGFKHEANQLASCKTLASKRYPS